MRGQCRVKRDPVSLEHANGQRDQDGVKLKPRLPDAQFGARIRIVDRINGMVQTNLIVTAQRVKNLRIALREDNMVAVIIWIARQVRLVHIFPLGPMFLLDQRHLKNPVWIIVHKLSTFSADNKGGRADTAFETNTIR